MLFYFYININNNANNTLYSTIVSLQTYLFIDLVKVLW